MAQDLGLAFRLTADAGGLVAGMAQAEMHLEKVGRSAQATSKDFREASKVVDSVATPTEKYSSTVKRLDDLLGKGALTWETHQRAVAKAAADMEKATAAAEKLAGAVAKIEPPVDDATATVEGLSIRFANLFGQGPAADKLTGAFDSLVGRAEAFAGTDAGGKLVAFGKSALEATGATDRLAKASQVAEVAWTLGTAAAQSLGLSFGGLVAAGNPATAVLALFAEYTDEAIGKAYSMADAVAATSAEAMRLGVSFEQLNLQKALDAGVAEKDLIRFNAALSEVDVRAFDDLAFAVEKSSEGTKRLGQATEGTIGVFGSVFTGLLEGLENGIGRLNGGVADLVGGFNDLARPIAQAFRPFGTLLGTIIDTVGGLIGVIGQVGGVILRVGGIAMSAFLGPVITGFNNFADTVKGGVGAAFDWLGKQIDWVNGLLDDTHELLKGIPIIGGAFASGSVEPAAGAAGGGAAAGGAGGQKAAIEEAEDFTAAIGRQEQALGRAIAQTEKLGEAGFSAALEYQTGLRDLNGQLEAGILNETSYAAGAEALRAAFESQAKAIEDRAAAQRHLAEEDMAMEEANRAAVAAQTEAFFKATENATKFGAAGAAAAAEYEGGLTALNAQLEDGRVNETAYAAEAEKLRGKYKGAIDQAKALHDAEKKRSTDIERMQERIEDAGAFQTEAANALSSKKNEALHASDIRSSEGIASFMALATGREDPAVAEYRKSHDTLKKMLAELEALKAAPLEIAGGAGG